MNEPVAATEAVRLLILAVITALVSFNAWNPSPEQIGAVLGLYAAASVVLSVFTRKQSTPTSKVALTNDQAAALGKP